MKTITIILKFEFEIEESDDESIKEALADEIESRFYSDEILCGAKVKVIDQNDDEPILEEDED